MHPIKLIPFNRPVQEMNTCLFNYENHVETLKLSFTVSGDINHLILPQLNSESLSKGTRSFKDSNRSIGLWESTCFEFFLGNITQSHYFEFNFNGRDKWNIFRLFEYRSPIKEYFFEAPVTYSSYQEQNTFTFKINIPKSIIPKEYFNPSKMIFNAAIIIQNLKQNNSQLWSLKHPTLEANFHQQSLWQKLKDT